MPRNSDFQVISEVPIPAEGHPWCRVVDVEVADENGTVPGGPWTVVRDGDGVQVLGLTYDDQVVLVVQTRVAVGVSRHIEVPQGKVGDETSEEAGRRELFEETGFRAGKMQQIYPLVNRFHARSDQWMHLFVANDLEKVTDQIDQSEITEVMVLPFEQAYNLIGKEGGIHEPATIILLQWLRIRRLEQALIQALQK